MKLVDQRVLRGPNVHTHKPCLQATVDLEDLDEVSSAMVPGFTDRLVDAMPTLVEHFCTVGRRGGFIERLREGTYMAHITEHVALELQSLAGHEVSYGKAREVTGRPGHYLVVVTYQDEHVAREALAQAIAIVGACAHDRAFDIDAHVRAVRERAAAQALGPSTQAVVEAARARGIPVLRLTDRANLFQLGWGARQRRIQATTTGRTSLVATEIASDKELTKQLLAEAGLPVPRGWAVRHVAEALDALSDLGGGPVVVKPLDANQGKGVTTAVMDEESLCAAFERAQVHGDEVIVEQHVAGDDYRVLVVSGRMVAASRRLPPQVTGDGRATVRQLAEAENANPARGDGHSGVLTRIPLDDAAVEELAHQGLHLDDVPAKGRPVRLRGNANLSTGGTAEDVTDRVHPQVAEACVRAARRVGLDVAGIDLVCQDIAAPMDGLTGAILEVNCAPGIRMHEHPSAGEARAAGAAIVDSLFPPNDDGRIPTVAITGSNGKTTTTLAVSHALKRLGRRVGTATTEGVYLDGRPIATGDCTGYWSARTVLTDPDVEVAVLETARGGILKRGLGFDRCDVGVVLNVQADHLGQDGVDTLEDLAHVKSLIAETARRVAVLNADDARVVAMAGRVKEGCEVLWIAADAANPVVTEHLRRGGRAVFRDRDALWLACGAAQVSACALSELPFTLGGHARHQVENAMAALAALVGLGVPVEVAARALADFSCDLDANPMRMNAFRVNDATLIMDYAHNADSYTAVGGTARSLAMQSGGRSIGIVAAPGDRRDADLVDVGRACGEAFDRLVVYEMDDRRGREPGEVAALLLRGARAARPGVPAELVLDVRRAVYAAVSDAQPGDVVVFGCASYVRELTDGLNGEFELRPVSLGSLWRQDPAATAREPASAPQPLLPARESAQETRAAWA